MLDSETYPKWASTFMPGSHYLGSWGEGSKIAFLAPDENGDLSGMVGMIKKSITNEYISIEYTGVVDEGEEHSSKEFEEEWSGAHENYTFNGLNGYTELKIELDTPEEYVDEMIDLWDRALQKLKKLVEGS